ncbi:MAG: hypothetical protein E7288_10940 [Lachnospiraceae bacterium]|nr:hypothetical protein [Lachnospiraceae bacterium]
MKSIQIKSPETPVKKRNYIIECFLWMLAILLIAAPTFVIALLNMENNETLAHILLIVCLAFSCFLLIMVSILGVGLLKQKSIETAWIRNMRGLSMPEFAQKATEVLKAVYSAETPEELNGFTECDLSFLLEDTANCTSCELGKYRINKITPVLAKRYVHMDQAVKLCGETTKSYILSVDFVRESDECDWKVNEAKIVPFKNEKEKKKWF